MTALAERLRLHPLRHHNNRIPHAVRLPEFATVAKTGHSWFRDVPLATKGVLVVDRTAWLIVIILPIVLLVRDLNAQDSDTALLRKATEAWHQYAAVIRRSFECDIEETFGTPEPGDDFAVRANSPIGGESQTTIRMFRGCQLAIISDHRGKRVHGRNELYDFLLNRVEDNLWEVKNVQLLDRRTFTGRNIGDLPQTAPALDAVRIERALLSDVVASPTFRLLSTEQSADDTFGRVVTLTFAAHHDVDDLNTIEGGTVSLLADHQWVLWKYRIDLKSTDKGAVLGRYRYQRLGDRLVPEISSVSYEFPRGERTRYVYRYNSPRECSTGKEGFRLLAFGIPEPAGIRTSILTRPVSLLLVFGLVIVTASLWVVWRNARS